MFKLVYKNPDTGICVELCKYDRIESARKYIWANVYIQYSEEAINLINSGKMSLSGQWL